MCWFTPTAVVPGKRGTGREKDAKPRTATRDPQQESAASKAALDEKMEKAKRVREQQETERKKRLEAQRTKEKQKRDAAAEKRRELDEKKRQEQLQKEKRVAGTGAAPGTKTSATHKPSGTTRTTPMATASAKSTHQQPPTIKSTTLKSTHPPSTKTGPTRTTTASSKTPSSPQAKKTTPTKRQAESPRAQKPKQPGLTSRLKDNGRPAAKKRKLEEPPKVEPPKKQTDSHESKAAVEIELGSGKDLDNIDIPVQPPEDGTTSDDTLIPSMALREGPSETSTSKELPSGAGREETNEFDDTPIVLEVDLDPTHHQAESKPSPAAPAGDGVLPDEFGAEWKEEEDIRKMKEENERAERRKVSRFTSSG